MSSSRAAVHRALTPPGGWPAGEVDIVFRARCDEGWPPPVEGIGAAIPADLTALARLHTEAFPGTYATARQLLVRQVLGGAELVG